MSGPTREDIKKVVEGWGFPLLSKKAHYFKPDMRSLCGKWLYSGELTKDDGKKGPDDCALCRKRLDAAIKVTEEGRG
jgi:hypothetical protein